jgi:hypothetical protein
MSSGMWHSVSSENLAFYRAVLSAYCGSRNPDTSVTVFQSTLHNIPEDLSLQKHHFQNKILNIGEYTGRAGVVGCYKNGGCHSVGLRHDSLAWFSYKVL